MARGDPVDVMPNIMSRSPLNKRDPRMGLAGGIPAGVYGPEQHFRKHDRETQEVARLRRLADVRAVVHSSRHQSMPPQMMSPQPPLPRLSPGGSEPNLHDFATRTHLARLDIAYEKLDTYVEQSVEQLLSAMNEQREKLEDWVEKKMTASEEKLAAAVATVQQTRSVLDSAVSSLSATGKASTQGADANLKAKLISLEERQSKLEKEQISSMSQQATPVEDLQSRLQKVTAQTAALETAVADLARSSSVTKDVHGRIMDARTDSIQSAVSDIAAQLEAMRTRQDCSPRHSAMGLDERFADQAELLRELDQKLQDQAATLDMRSASLQALVEEKVASIEEKLRDGCLVVDQKSGMEVVLSPKSSQAPVVEQLSQAVHEVIDRIGAIETKTEELRNTSTSRIAELQSEIANLCSPEPSESAQEGTEDLTERVAQDVQMGLADLFFLANKQPGTKAGDDVSPTSRSPQNASPSPANKQFHAVVSRVGCESLVQRDEFLSLKARVEGGFQAIVVQLQTQSWVTEQCDDAADKLVQAFSFNLDNRITDIETRLHKSEAVIDKVMEKNKMKVKKVEVSAHCFKCGRSMPADADTCQYCGASKPVRQRLVPKRAVRAAQEHNYHLVKITFDIWARGLNAKCLTDLATTITEETGVDVTPSTLTRSESRVVFDSGCSIVAASHKHFTEGLSPESGNASAAARSIRRIF